MYTMSHTEDFVREMYKRMGILKPQQLNYQHIAEQLGIKLFYWDDSSQALFSKDRACICLDKNLSPQQMWQEFCHELGHVLFHWGNQRHMSESFRKYQEAKANYFMYRACVPSFMLHELKIEDYSFKNVKLVQQLFNVEYAFALRCLTYYVNKKFIMLNLHSS